MDSRHLVQLATILERGSITRASQVLHLTQPTLTHNMRTLEMQAGGRLFERSRLGVRSTPLGELLAREGRDIQRRIADARAASARHRLGMRNHVRIGSGPIIGAALLDGLAERLLQQQPDLGLTLQCDRTHLLVEQLVDGLHDLAIAPTWLDRPPQGIARERLVADSLGIFCGPGHPLAQRGRLTAEDDEGLRWLTLGEASPFDKGVFSMLNEVGLSAARAEISARGDAMVLLRLLMQGRHLAVLPRVPVLLMRGFFPVVELQTDAAPRSRDIYVWTREAQHDDPVLAAVRRTVLDHAAERVAELQGIGYRGADER